MIYSRNNDGSLSLESAGFSSGRIYATTGGTEVNYFLTDHLGSVRQVVTDDGQRKQTNDYYPFGGRWTDSRSLASDNRFLFNGKELQTTGGEGYLDYGARMYDPEIGRWNSIDPLAEDYSMFGPYAFTANNPVGLIDPDGRDIWTVTKSGYVEFYKKYDKGHYLVLLEDGRPLEEGKELAGKWIRIFNENILKQLDKNKSTLKHQYSNEEFSGQTTQTHSILLAESGSGPEMLRLFKFLADNTDVEWNFTWGRVASGRRHEGKDHYSIKTLGMEGKTKSVAHRDEIIMTIHSHPKAHELTNGTKWQSEIYSMESDRDRSYDRSYSQYVYIPQSTNLFHISKGRYAYIRKIHNNYKRFINVGF